MNEPARKMKYTFAEYLAYDEANEGKHEFLDGEIYAMAGGTARHSLLAMNLGRALGNQIEGRRPCRIFGADMRFRVLETGLATYPDLSVVCGKLQFDPESTTTLTNPLVLVEVISPSSEKYDRIFKQRHYLRIPTLREYLLVWQDELYVQHYTRNEDDSWTFRNVRPPQPLNLPSLGVTISLDEIYRGVFDP